MTTRLVLNRWEDKFLPGSLSDSQLFHADASDRILVCPPHLGQGYIQIILLEDDLDIVIHDFTFNQDVVRDSQETGKHLRFEFQIAGAYAGYSFFIPSFGLKRFEIAPTQKRFFEIEIIFKKSILTDYFQAFMERLSPSICIDAKSVLQSICRYQGIGPNSTVTGMLNQIFEGESCVHTDGTFEETLTEDSYSALVSLFHAARHPITSAMEQVIGQILSCPYQGISRRTYLKGKAMKLVSLYLEALVQPHSSSSTDLDCIYQAAAILSKQLASPPTVEALVRQVGTNRLYLNQGFHQVYGTTPYGYLRECRLWKARQLLLTSDLSIGEVAATVGYAYRSHFATAFRQRMGLNPKPFQMEAWRCAS